MRGEQAIFNLEIKKKRRSSIISISTIQKFSAQIKLRFGRQLSDKIMFDWST